MSVVIILLINNIVSLTLPCIFCTLGTILLYGITFILTTIYPPDTLILVNIPFGHLLNITKNPQDAINDLIETIRTQLLLPICFTDTLKKTPLGIIKISVEPPRHYYVYTFNPQEQFKYPNKTLWTLIIFSLKNPQDNLKCSSIGVYAYLLE